MRGFHGTCLFLNGKISDGKLAGLEDSLLCTSTDFCLLLLQKQSSGNIGGWSSGLYGILWWSLMGSNSTNDSVVNNTGF